MYVMILKTQGQLFNRFDIKQEMNRIITFFQSHLIGIDVATSYKWHYNSLQFIFPSHKIEPSKSNKWSKWVQLGPILINYAGFDCSSTIWLSLWVVITLSTYCTPSTADLNDYQP
jgi:hypothetical protein